MEISLNDLVFSELDQNKVGNIVLKYIIYENSLRGNISNIWPSSYQIKECRKLLGQITNPCKKDSPRLENVWKYYNTV